MPSLEQVRDQLESEAGVSPSISWLEQCVRHIRGHNGNNNNNDVISSSNIDQAETESIWDQIRHSDLRNVIREPSSSNNNSNAASGATINTAANAAAMQLRQAISQSKMTNSSSNAANNGNSSNNSRNKAVLPQNFQLMIQLEEVVDGTQNSEQRLASMGANNSLIASSSNNNSNQYNNSNSSNNNNNNNRSEKWRSLKMVFSDGYYSNGLRTYSNNNNNEENNVLYAMEISPITNLSTASVPGTKILLHGPITIRHGMLQLNDENAFVIGGQVPSWREIWTKAREKALREGGVGVDPTIKALIWNPLMGNEEEVDEGDGESGDVTAPRAPPPQQQQPLPPGGGQSHTTLPVITPNHSMENRTQSHHQRGNNHVTNTTTTGTANMNNAATSRRENFRQTTLDSYPKQNRTVSAAATTATTAAVTSNPYQQRSSYQNNSTNQQSSQHQQQRQTANPYASTNQQQQQLQKTNPYASLRQNNITDQSNSSTGISSQDDAIDLTESPANVSTRMIDTTSTSDIPQVAISSRNSTPNATSNNSSSSKPLSGNLSFSEFKSLMQSLRHNRVLYEQYYGKEIVVLCKISSGSENKVFNIVKDGGGGGGGDKKSKGKKEKVSLWRICLKCTKRKHFILFPTLIASINYRTEIQIFPCKQFLRTKAIRWIDRLSSRKCTNGTFLPRL